MPDRFVVRGRINSTLTLLLSDRCANRLGMVFCTGDYYLPAPPRNGVGFGSPKSLAFTLYAACCRQARSVFAFVPVATTFSVQRKT